MKSFLLSLLLLAGLQLLHAQENKTNWKIQQDAGGNPILLGQCPREALQTAPFDTWFLNNYNQYRVDTATCKLVEPLLRNKQITLFMGTWCGDSRREVPRIVKILDCCNFPPEQLKLVMLGNQDSMYKKSPNHEEAGHNIVRVPTIIIQLADKEEGRIVEYPVVSLEKDLLAILRKEPYRHHYAVATP